MKTSLCFSAAVLAAGCSGGKITDYALVEEHLIVVTGEDVLRCPLEEPAHVGAREFAPNPACEVLSDVNRASDWDLAAAVAANGQKLSATRVASGPRVRSDGKWVVWVDTRHDRNGLCRWPHGDADCAIDLYGIDLETGLEHRLTQRSSVYPPGGWAGFDSFSVNDGVVVYVDASAPNCGRLGINNDGEYCASRVYAIDLDTITERVLSRPDRIATRVRAGGGALAWFELVAEGKQELTYASLHAEPGRVEDFVAVGPHDQALNFEVAGSHVVYQVDHGERSEIHAIDVYSGERRVLTSSDEFGRGPVTGGRRVVWTNEGADAIFVFDFDRGERRTLVDLR